MLPQVKTLFVDLELDMFPDNKKPIIDVDNGSETKDKGTIDLTSTLKGEKAYSDELLSPDLIRSSWHKLSFNKLSKKEKISENLTKNFSLLVNPKKAFKGHNKIGMAYVPMNTGQ